MYVSNQSSFSDRSEKTASFGTKRQKSVHQEKLVHFRALHKFHLFPRYSLLSNQHFWTFIPVENHRAYITSTSLLRVVVFLSRISNEICPDQLSEGTQLEYHFALWRYTDFLQNVWHLKPLTFFEAKSEQLFNFQASVKRVFNDQDIHSSCSSSSCLWFLSFSLSLSFKPSWRWICIEMFSQQHLFIVVVHNILLLQG